MFWFGFVVFIYICCIFFDVFRLAFLLRMIRFARVSSRCKGDAFLFSYILIFPSAPSGALTMLRLASSLFF